jgi:hypothetical protein
MYKSFKPAIVGSNSILECKILPKSENRTFSTCKNMCALVIFSDRHNDPMVRDVPRNGS